MPEYKFTSNIKCSNCEASVKKVLDARSEIEKFEVDLQDPNRNVLIKATDGTTEKDVIGWVNEAGFELKSKGSFLKKLFK